jgi:hypothetical protein
MFFIFFFFDLSYYDYRFRHSHFISSAGLVGTFTFVAKLPVKFTPAYSLPGRFSNKTSNPTLVAVTSSCFARYHIPNMFNYTYLDSFPVEDASCAKCGCGVGGQIIQGIFHSLLITRVR